MIKRILRASFLCFLLLFATTIGAQIETNPSMRQVIASGGGTADFAWGSIDFTIGEAIVTSVSVTPSNNFPDFEWLTQGFQQPTEGGLILSYENGITNSSCIDAKNGSIAFKVINSTGLVKITITSSSTSATITGVAEDSSATFKDLAPNDYFYVAKDDGNHTFSGSFTIIENQIDCNELVVIYNGITPNGDGANDFWVIDSITNFETNTVSIFNRWGNRVWTAKDYNNTSVVWRGTNQNEAPLPDGTYFYIIEAGGEVEKGWVELTH